MKPWLKQNALNKEIEKKNKEEQRIADKLKRDQDKEDLKLAKLAEREGAAKEKEAKKVADAAAKKGHRKPKSAYNFFCSEQIREHGKTMKEIVSKATQEQCTCNRV